MVQEIIDQLPTDLAALPKEDASAIKALVKEVSLAHPRLHKVVVNQLETQGYVDKKIAQSTMRFLTDMMECDEELKLIFTNAEKAIGKYLPAQAKREDMLRLLFADPDLEFEDE